MGELAFKVCVYCGALMSKLATYVNNRYHAHMARHSRPPAERPSVEQRVKHIMELMARDVWETKLIGQLAQEWELTPSAVRRASAEASRRLMADLDDEQLRAVWEQRLDSHAGKDGAGSIQALKLQGDYRGYVNSDRKLVLELKGQVGESPEEQLRQLLAEDKFRRRVWQELIDNYPLEVPVLTDARLAKAHELGSGDE